MKNLLESMRQRNLKNEEIREIFNTPSKQKTMYSHIMETVKNGYYKGIGIGWQMEELEFQIFHNEGKHIEGRTIDGIKWFLEFEPQWDRLIEKVNNAHILVSNQPYVPIENGEYKIVQIRPSEAKHLMDLEENIVFIGDGNEKTVKILNDLFKISITAYQDRESFRGLEKLQSMIIIKPTEAGIPETFLLERKE